MKNDTEELINPDYKIQDSDMKSGQLYTHGTQTYKLEYYNSEKVTLWNEGMKHRHEERRAFFQEFYNKK